MNNTRFITPLSMMNSHRKDLSILSLEIQNLKLRFHKKKMSLSFHHKSRIRGNMDK